MEHKLKKDQFMAEKSNKSNKEKHLSVRVTNATHAKIATYANAHEITVSKAVEQLIEKALKTELEPLATKNDIETLKSKLEVLEAAETTRNTILLDAIKNQPVTVQELALPKKDDKPKGLFSRLFKMG